MKTDSVISLFRTRKIHSWIVALFSNLKVDIGTKKIKRKKKNQVYVSPRNVIYISFCMLMRILLNILPMASNSGSQKVWTQME